jgi:hypothetical protein
MRGFAHGPKRGAMDGDWEMKRLVGGFSERWI